MTHRQAALATAVFLALIAWIADTIQFPYVLFPELGALGWVLFSDARHPWSRSPGLLVLTPFLSAVQGLWITRYMAYGPASVILDVALSLLVIRGLRSPVAPALSAGLLPLALGIRSWNYPFSILVGTFLLALFSGLRRGSARQTSPATSEEEGQSLPPLRDWILPFGVFLLGGLVLVSWIGSPLVLFPPLLVIAWETLAHRLHCPWRGRYLGVLVATCAAACIGLGLVKWLGVSPAAVFLTVLATLALLRLLRLPFPPALGLALLPFVIPQPPLTYPLTTLAGTCWLVMVALVQDARADGKAVPNA